MISLLPLRKLPLNIFQQLQANFAELEMALKREAPIPTPVICMMASWYLDQQPQETDDNLPTEKVVIDGIVIYTMHVWY